MRFRRYVGGQAFAALVAACDPILIIYKIIIFEDIF